MTGDNSEKMKEYRITKDWKRKLNDDSSAFGVTATGEATEDDLKLLEGMSAQSSSSQQAPEVQVKAEPQTKSEIEDAAFADFKTNVALHLRRFQDCDLEARQLAKFLLTVKFSESVVEGLKKHQVILTKVVIMLSKACEHDLEKSMFRRLVAAMKWVRNSQCELVAHGVKLGFKSNIKKRRVVE